MAVVRRHRLIEEFLVKALDVPWEDVHAEAEVLEHAVSDRLLERIDAFLGHPTHDPHGDPIPSSDGAHVERWTTPLSQAALGETFRVERVRDRDRERCATSASSGFALESCWMWSSRLHSAGRCG